MPGFQNAICLVIDRLSAAYLGALGNTWIHTPAFDQLAAESMVFDRATIDSPALVEVYRSYWTGEPAWLRSGAMGPSNRPSLPEFCHQQSVPIVLLTDESAVADHPLAAGFDEIVRLKPSERTGTAADWQETQLAEFFAAAIELLESMQVPALVWLHTGALGRVWDSPQSMRDKYADEDDPPPPALEHPPSLVISDDADPDLHLGLRHAYAGEVSVLDHCLGLLIDTIAAGAWCDALLCVTSSRGYPLGEHGYVGDAADPLYGELIHVPWLMRLPGGSQFGARSQALVQPADLNATLLEWLSPARPVEPQPAAAVYARKSLMPHLMGGPFERLLTITKSATLETALGTPAWFLRASAESAEERRVLTARGVHSDLANRRLELFVKPDDYFEINEVSDRCHEIIDEFQQLLREIDSSMRGGQLANPVLSDSLVHGIEAAHGTG